MSQSSQKSGRTWLRLAVGVALAAAATVAPVSPLALGTADALAGSGRISQAIALYDAVARYTPLEAQAEAALYRAATLHALDPADPEGSRRRLLAAVQRYPDSPRAAAAWELLGLRAELPARSAAALSNAYEADPHSDRAQARLTAAAAAWVSAGAYGKALAHYSELAAAFPDSRARVDIERGRIALLQGEVEESLGHFVAAMPHANEPAARATARLGVASCMERLGDLEGALAELDVVDMPDTALETRRTAISQRRGLRDGL